MSDTIRKIDNQTEFLTLLNQANNSNKLVIANFYTEWCGPCKLADIEFLNYASNFKDKAIFVKVDCDENEDTAIEYGVECMPTFIAFKQNEKVGEEKGTRIEKIRTFFNDTLEINK
jgi:thioredoxin 1